MRSGGGSSSSARLAAHLARSNCQGAEAWNHRTSGARSHNLSSAEWLPRTHAPRPQNRNRKESERGRVKRAVHPGSDRAKSLFAPSRSLLDTSRQARRRRKAVAADSSRPFRRKQPHSSDRHLLLARSNQAPSSYLHWCVCSKKSDLSNRAHRLPDSPLAFSTSVFPPSQ